MPEGMYRMRFSCFHSTTGVICLGTLLPRRLVTARSQGRGSQGFFAGG